MATKNILALVGGISSTSINQKLYNEIVKHNNTGLVFELFDIASLPFYTQDKEQNLPNEVAQLKEQVHRADAVLIVTPEYNRSIPGVLKNAIDWGSRPYGNNCWNAKPAAIIGASIGGSGTLAAQQHLRNICSMVNMHVLSQPEFYFNATANMTDSGLSEKSIPFAQKFLATFETWISKF